MTNEHLLLWNCVDLVVFVLRAEPVQFAECFRGSFLLFCHIRRTFRIAPLKALLAIAKLATIVCPSGGSVIVLSLPLGIEARDLQGPH